MTIDSRTLYATLLGLTKPWEITDAEMKQPPGEVHVRVRLPEGTLWVCPKCGAAAPIHDHRERSWPCLRASSRETRYQGRCRVTKLDRLSIRTLVTTP